MHANTVDMGNVFIPVVCHVPIFVRLKRGSFLSEDHFSTEIRCSSGHVEPSLVGEHHLRDEFPMFRGFEDWALSGL